MRKSRFYLRVIALFLVKTFLLQQVAMAAPDLKAFKVDLFQKPATRFSIPESIAAVDDAHDAGRGSKLIYLLQDAHTNSSGQMNLAKTLEHLFAQEKDLKTVFLEGGRGDNSLSFFRSFAPLAARKIAAEKYLKRGELQGEEYLDLVSDRAFTLWGVEDMALYQKALEDYRAVAKEREAFRAYLAKIAVTLETLKPRVLNASLLEFDRARGLYRKEDRPITDYFQFLTAQAVLQNVPLSSYGHLSALKRLKEKESRIDFAKATDEQRRFFEALPESQRAELLEVSDAGEKSPFKMSTKSATGGEAFYALLGEKLKALGGNGYPELKKYVFYLYFAKKIDPRQVLSELKSLESRIVESLTESEKEKNLLKCDTLLGLHEKLFNFSLTPEDYEEYTRLSREWRIAHLTGFLNKHIVELDEYYENFLFLEEGYEPVIKRAEEFYALTQARDAYFIDKALEKMSAENETEAALITGGFHTPNLKSLLKARGVSYVSITPQVFHETNQKRYEKILLSQPAPEAAPQMSVSTASATHRPLAAGFMIRNSSSPELTIAGRIAADLNVQPAAARLASKRKRPDWLQAEIRPVAASPAAKTSTVTQQDMDDALEDIVLKLVTGSWESGSRERLLARPDVLSALKQSPELDYYEGELSKKQIQTEIDSLLSQVARPGTAKKNETSAARLADSRWPSVIRVMSAMILADWLSKGLSSLVISNRASNPDGFLGLKWATHPVSFTDLLFIYAGVIGTVAYFMRYDRIQPVSKFKNAVDGLVLGSVFGNGLEAIFTGKGTDWIYIHGYVANLSDAMLRLSVPLFVVLHIKGLISIYRKLGPKALFHDIRQLTLEDKDNEYPAGARLASSHTSDMPLGKGQTTDDILNSIQKLNVSETARAVVASFFEGRLDESATSQIDAAELALSESGLSFLREKFSIFGEVHNKAILIKLRNQEGKGVPVVIVFSVGGWAIGLDLIDAAVNDEVRDETTSTLHVMAKKMSMDLTQTWRPPKNFLHLTLERQMMTDLGWLPDEHSHIQRLGAAIPQRFLISFQRRSLGSQIFLDEQDSSAFGRALAGWNEIYRKEKYFGPATSAVSSDDVLSQMKRISYEKRHQLRSFVEWLAYTSDSGLVSFVPEIEFGSILGDQKYKLIKTGSKVVTIRFDLEKYHNTDQFSDDWVQAVLIDWYEKQLLSLVRSGADPYDAFSKQVATDRSLLDAIGLKEAGEIRVLEAAAGNGSLSFVLAERGAKVDAFDGVHDRRDQARIFHKKLRSISPWIGEVQYHTNPMSRLSQYKDSSYDLVIERFSLFMAPLDLKIKYLSALYSKLKPGGRLVLIERAADDIYEPSIGISEFMQKIGLGSARAKNLEYPGYFILELTKQSGARLAEAAPVFEAMLKSLGEPKANGKVELSVQGRQFIWDLMSTTLVAKFGERMADFDYRGVSPEASWVKGPSPNEEPLGLLFDISDNPIFFDVTELLAPDSLSSKQLSNLHYRATTLAERRAQAEMGRGVVQIFMLKKFAKRSGRWIPFSEYDWHDLSQPLTMFSIVKAGIKETDALIGPDSEGSLDFQDLLNTIYAVEPDYVKNKRIGEIGVGSGVNILEAFRHGAASYVGTDLFAAYVLLSAWNVEHWKHTGQIRRDAEIRLYQKDGLFDEKTDVVLFNTPGIGNDARELPPGDRIYTTRVPLFASFYIQRTDFKRLFRSLLNYLDAHHAEGILRVEPSEGASVLSHRALDPEETADSYLNDTQMPIQHLAGNFFAVNSTLSAARLAEKSLEVKFNASQHYRIGFELVKAPIEDPTDELIRELDRVFNTRLNGEGAYYAIGGIHTLLMIAKAATLPMTVIDDYFTEVNLERIGEDSETPEKTVIEYFPLVPITAFSAEKMIHLPQLFGAEQLLLSLVWPYQTVFDANVRQWTVDHDDDQIFKVRIQYDDLLAGARLAGGISRWFDYLSDPDRSFDATKAPDVYLALGVWDTRPYVELAKKWKQWRDKGVVIPIIASAGRGKGYRVLRSVFVRDYPDGDTASEARMIAYVLEKNGVDPAQIHLEEKSIDTVGNFEESAALIQRLASEKGVEQPRIQIATAPLHNRRSFNDARRVYRGKPWTVTVQPLYSATEDAHPLLRAVTETAILASWPVLSYGPLRHAVVRGLTSNVYSEIDKKDGARLAEDATAWGSIAKRLLWISTRMIDEANHEKGEIKVGGHQAAAASSLHIMMALELFARGGNDHVAHKPHAGPVYHAIQYLLGHLPKEALFRLRENAIDPAADSLPSGSLEDRHREELEALSAEILATLPESARKDFEKIGLHSYPGMADPDGVTIPTGSVGMGGAQAIALALQNKKARENGHDVEPAHFYAVAGDAESEEGNLQEILPLVKEHGLSNVTHVIDYNRQSLDGNTEDFKLETLKGRYAAAGWKVVELKWGSRIQETFAEHPQFSETMEKLSHEQYQMMIALDDAGVREFLLSQEPDLEKVLSKYTDAQLGELVKDLGGHDLALLVTALENDRNDGEPTVIIAHTIKGWGLKPMIGKPANHSQLMKTEEMEALRLELSLPKDDAFPEFDAGSAEGRLLNEMAARIRAEKTVDTQRRKANEDEFKTELPEAAFPKTISTTFPTHKTSTQNHLGFLVTKLRTARSSGSQEPADLFWKAIGRRFVTISPDVGTSTGIANPGMIDPMHIRMGITEMNAVTVATAFGKSRELTGVPMFPMVTVYDMFLFRRALDMFFYGQYWKSRFIAVGTPTGSALSPEGAQHQDISAAVIGRSLPNTITWEPAFPAELDFILAETFRRAATEDDEGRNAVYLRTSTLPVDGSELLKRLKAQSRYAGRSDEEIISEWQEDVLKGGYRLVDHRGEADYSPGETVINIVTAGPLVNEAMAASDILRKAGFFANVIVVSSVDLMLGTLAEKTGYAYLKTLIPQNERSYTPVLTVADASPEYLGGIGDILGLNTQTINLGLKKNGLSTRSPHRIFRHHGIGRFNIARTAYLMMDKIYDEPAGARLAEEDEDDFDADEEPRMPDFADARLILDELDAVYKEIVSGVRPDDPFVGYLQNNVRTLRGLLTYAENTNSMNAAIASYIKTLFEESHFFIHRFFDLSTHSELPAWGERYAHYSEKVSEDPFRITEMAEIAVLYGRQNPFFTRSVGPVRDFDRLHRDMRQVLQYLRNDSAAPRELRKLFGLQFHINKHLPAPFKVLLVPYAVPNDTFAADGRNALPFYEDVRGERAHQLTYFVNLSRLNRGDLLRDITERVPGLDHDEKWEHFVRLVSRTQSDGARLASTENNERLIAIAKQRAIEMDSKIEKGIAALRKNGSTFMYLQDLARVLGVGRHTLTHSSRSETAKKMIEEFTDVDAEYLRLVRVAEKTLIDSDRRPTLAAIRRESNLGAAFVAFLRRKPELSRELLSKARSWKPKLPNQTEKQNLESALIKIALAHRQDAHKQFAFLAQALQVMRIVVDADASGRVRSVTLYLNGQDKPLMTVKNPNQRYHELKKSGVPLEVGAFTPGELLVLLKVANLNAELALEPISPQLPVAVELPLHEFSHLANIGQFETQLKFALAQAYAAHSQFAKKRAHITFFFSGKDLLTSQQMSLVDKISNESYSNFVQFSEASDFKGVVVKLGDADTLAIVKGGKKLYLPFQGLSGGDLHGWGRLFIFAYALGAYYSPYYNDSASRIEIEEVDPSALPDSYLVYFNSNVQKPGSKIDGKPLLAKIVEGRATRKEMKDHSFFLPLAVKIPLDTIVKGARLALRQIGISA